MQSTEKQFVFVTRDALQQMLKLKRGLSEISIILAEQQITPVTTRLKEALPAETYEILTWRQLLPFLTAYLKILDVFVYIWCLVVFIAMGFGIVNTTLMAVFERIREFGLLKSLGMKPWWIIREILTESLLLLIVGSIIGNILAFISVYALSDRGIDLSTLAAGTEFFGMTRVIYPVLTATDLYIANLVVVILGLLVSIYPAVKASRFSPVEAMAHT
jgi:ABC-type lipoprotein release transport system permease subunit